MRKIIIAILVLLAAAACNKSKDGWKLVWTEDFTGNEINTDTWSRVELGKGDWNNMMSLREDVAFIEDGQLVLLGKVNDGTSGDTTAFVTGGVRSKGKKSFSLAKFEIKAKFNCVNGFWPALWLMPDNDIPWPLGGEVDIMEHLNSDKFVYQTLHSNYTKNVDPNATHYSTAEINPDDWNIYGVEIYKDSICMFTNGVKYLSYHRIEGAETQFPWSESPFYLILSNQLEGSWVGKVDSPEQLPSELRIDWIKVYQR